MSTPTAGSTKRSAWLYTAVDLFTQTVMFMVLIATFGTTILVTQDRPAEAKENKKEEKALSQAELDKQKLERLLKQDKTLSLRVTKGRLAISLKDRIFFETGSAELKPTAQETIGRLAATLQAMDCQLWVAGYTDNVPIATAQYPSNWALATARAITVLKILQASGVTPQRLAAAGYGQYHPRYPNNSPKNRAGNRRVEISLVYR
ncbi:MAG: OmpA family protein [Deltaproteobacteria bacterium]|nr:OmpA family protein [Deltaproteobacteria bacterium]